MSVTELENKIAGLSPSDFDQLMVWIDDYRSDLWDKQIAEDLEAGRLDEMHAFVKTELAGGRVMPL